MVKSSKKQMQDDENKVLEELTKNSKENIDTIAKHCGFSRQKVWRIIRQLEESHIIWGYTAIVDEQKQGLQKFIMFFKRSLKMFDKEAAEEVNLDGILQEYLKIGIKIESSYHIHGEYDWIIIFTAKDLIHAKKFCNLLLTKYPGIIQQITLSSILYTPRNHYIINPDSLKAKDIP
jgi:Lrp/AsnC family transcriptional regulator, leucine-responsive regulatory protein